MQLGEEHIYPYSSQMAKVERGETVWKFGIDPKSGLRKRPKGVEGVYIGRLLAPKKRSRDSFSYFPNSFGRGILRSS